MAEDIVSFHNERERKEKKTHVGSTLIIIY